MGLGLLTAGFSDELRDAVQAAWRLGVQRSGQLGKLHEEVSRVLWRMGVLHRNQCILCDSMFCVDLALEGDKVRTCSLSLPAIALCAGEALPKLMEVCALCKTCERHVKEVRAGLSDNIVRVCH